VTIPKSVANIEYGAFFGCTSLDTVIFAIGSDIIIPWETTAFSTDNSGYTYSGASLWTAYTSGGTVGTYTRIGNVWTKQP
jgi:hypothetical protein